MAHGYVLYFGLLLLLRLRENDFFHIVRCRYFALSTCNLLLRNRILSVNRP